MVGRGAQKFARTAIALSIVSVVAGCAAIQAPGSFSSSKVSPLNAGSLFSSVGRVDETFERAPELFRASGLVKWNGVGTVRGIWVTHPEATTTRRVRIVNTATGVETDGMLYKSDGSGPQDSVTVSSDAAQALKIAKDQPVLVSLFGLKLRQVEQPGTPEPVYGGTAQQAARSELINHVLRMDPGQLLQLVSAAMRGMGYATRFEQGTAFSPQAEILAIAAPGAGGTGAPVRIAVRGAREAPASAAQIARLQQRLTARGEVGVVVSISGFTADVAPEAARGGAHMEMVDLDGLLAIWQTNYDRLSVPDQALLRLPETYRIADRLAL